MKKRRRIAKSKTYGFNPYLDQIDTINLIMRETGETTESVLLRKLVDEALEARRKKSESLPLTDESDNAFGERFEAVETLLMRLVRQEYTSVRIQGVCLELLQDVLAEIHATRRLSWESLAVPRLREEGIDSNELDRLFVRQLDSAKVYAYRLAKQIKQTEESKT